MRAAPRKGRTVQAETIEARIENYLIDRRLQEVLSVLERKNRDRLRERREVLAPSERKNRDHFREKARKRAPLLLGPYLHYITRAVESRREAIAKMPALGRTPAELREHYREIAHQAAALAAALRKAPQPNVVPMPREAGEAFGVFWPTSEFFFEGATQVSELLDKAATTVRSIAGSVSAKVPRRTGGKTKHDRQQASQIRRFVAIRFSDFFRRELGRPLHEHVATIATVLSGIATDADYVKKAEKRGPAARGQNSPKK
jgi:hypothetical protein